MADTGTQAVAVEFTRRPGRPVAREEGLALVRECFGMYIDGLRDAVHTSVNATNDLFDVSEQVSARMVAEFRTGRARWLAEYERALRAGYQRRILGHLRTGRRTDTQAGSATLQLLDPLDQVMQVALIGAVRSLQSIVQPELCALSPRLAVALGEKFKQDFDNPFDPQYLLDAIGSSARSIYSTPSVWRALMQRVVTDITPVLNKIYIAQNRYLADQNVLPDIKAWLRNWSRHRPTNDREVVAKFRQLHADRIAGKRTVPRVRVPQVRFAGGPKAPQGSREPAPPAQLRLTRAGIASKPADARTAPPPIPLEVIRGALVTLVKDARESAAALGTLKPRTGPGGFPAVDATLMQGTARGLVAILGELQRVDLLAMILPSAPLKDGAPADAALIPANLIPHLRAAVDPQYVGPESAATMDFVALLFDYIFEDPSIPGTLHGVFVRLEVPILKAALLDAHFFSDHEHPARQLLDDLAQASIGAAGNDEYFGELHAVAMEVVELICANYRYDGSVIDEAAAKLRRFVTEDDRRTATTLSDDIATALASERRELARSEAVSMIRTRLAGIDVPPRIRNFVEVVWVAYVADIKRKVGPDDPRLAKPLRTLEDLLWTITAKERFSQRKRLCEVIPSMISELRRGCVAVNFPAERTRAFMNELYEMHRKVIENGRVAAVENPEAVEVAPAVEDPVPETDSSEPASGRVFDFVCEMIVGTWIEAVFDAKVVTMRLYWVSPLRTRYVFGTRRASRGWVLSPEELALDIECGKASIKVEPVPLVDRAVNAAFETLGAAAA
jgi:hypothetical protein